MIRIRKSTNTGNYGRQKVGKTPSVLGRLVGADNPDGRGTRDAGVRIRSSRRG